MGRRLTWDWQLFWRVFLATAYFHLSVEIAFLLILFIVLFSHLGGWAWVFFTLWVVNLFPAALAGRWAGRQHRHIASWQRTPQQRNTHGTDS